MCERLLNLQEIYVSGQNICIEVYGNSVGTITPARELACSSILIHFRPTSSSENKRWKILSIFIYLYPSTLSYDCSDSVCVKNIKDANKNIFTCYSHY